MNDTPNLILPYILAAQSQKHVTHNEAIRALDALVQIAALDRNLSAPPPTPAEGDRYIVAASPTGAWTGQANKIAAFQDAAWLFYAPKEGWIAWVADENIAVVFDGADWTALSSGGGGGSGVTDHGLLTGLADDDHAQYHNNARGDARYTLLNPLTLGINATADTTNRLAVGSAASLFSHSGTGGHQIKINKAASTDTASFLFQTGFSGRAELGTTGDDDFHFKVSANGSTFTDAILINRTTGAVALPNTTLGTGTVTNVATGTGLAGGPITAAGTISLANMAAATLKGNSTGATAAPSDLTAAQVKTMLAIAASDVSGLGSLASASSVNLATQATGTLQAAQEPAHSGDVTNTAGSLALTIAANAVTNAKAAQMGAGTLKGNSTGATAAPADLTASQTTAMLDVFSSTLKGLAPASNGGTTNFLRADGVFAPPPGAGGGEANTASNAGAGGVGVFKVKSGIDLQFKNISAGSSAITVTDNTPSNQVDIGVAAGGVGNAMLAVMAGNTIKGNNTGSSASPVDLTAAQVQALLAAQPTVQTFTASGTWTKPTGCKRVRVRAIGGGGGGAGATATSAQSCGGGGGSSGSYGEAVFDFTSTSSLSVTIGAAGTAGAAANGIGGNGGTTSFGGIMSCPGGVGGNSMTSGTAAAIALGGTQPAVATGGLIIAAQGQGGGHGFRLSGTVAKGGDGSASVFGGAQRGSNVAAAVTASVSPGAGGQGAISTSATGFAGAAGAAGILIVEEFY